jgi:hypothetical protein
MGGVFDEREVAPTAAAEVAAPIKEAEPQPPDIAYVAHEARKRERKTYVFLGILIAVAVAAVGAGVVADNNVFWAIAGSVFFMSCAGLVAYAATGLGIVAAMLDIIRYTSPRPPEPVTATRTRTASYDESMAEPESRQASREREGNRAEGEGWRL